MQTRRWVHGSSSPNKSVTGIQMCWFSSMLNDLMHLNPLYILGAPLYCVFCANECCVLSIGEWADTVGVVCTVYCVLCTV